MSDYPRSVGQVVAHLKNYPKLRAVLPGGFGREYTFIASSGNDIQVRSTAGVEVTLRLGDNILYFPDGFSRSMHRGYRGSLKYFYQGERPWRGVDESPSDRRRDQWDEILKHARV